MDKTEYNIRLDQIKALLSEHAYADAMEVCNTIDWKKVKSASTLCTVSEIYKVNRKYEDAKDILLLAYEKHPGGRRIVYALCELFIKLEDVVQACEYFKEYCRIAPKDSSKYILQYKLFEAQDVSLEERIAVLEEYKKKEYREKWAYELAYMYHRIGLATKCVEECDELILWFGEGKYVQKAMELKMLHKPLNQNQQEKYDRMMGTAEDEEYFNEESSAEETKPAAETKVINPVPDENGIIPTTDEDAVEVRTLNVDKYSTLNIQAELSKSFQEFFEGEAPKSGVILETTKEADSEKPEGDVQEPAEAEAEIEKAIEAPVEEPDSVDAAESEQEKTQEETVRVSHPEDKLNKILSQDDDGQISMVVPDPPVVDKQITGQMNISGYLEEWENQRRERQRKRIAEAKLKSLEQTNDILSRLEGRLPNITAPLPTVDELAQKVVLKEETGPIVIPELHHDYNTDKLIPELGNIAVKSSAAALEPEVLEEALEQEYIEEEIPEQEYSEEEYSEENYPEEEYESEEYTEEDYSEEEYESEEYAQEDYSEEEYESEEYAEEDYPEEEYESEEYAQEDYPEEEYAEEEYDDSRFDTSQIPVDEFATGQIPVEELPPIEDVNTNSARSFPTAQLPEIQDIVSLENEQQAEEEPQETEASDEAEYTEDYLEDEYPEEDYPEEDNYEPEYIENDSPIDDSEMEEFFGPLLQMRSMKTKLSEVLAKATMNPVSGNVLVTGNEKAARIKIALGIAKSIQRNNVEFTGKLAKVPAEVLNTKDVRKAMASMNHGALIIENAGLLNVTTLDTLAKVVNHSNVRIVIILEDRRNEMKKLSKLRSYFATMFDVSIDIPTYSNNDLVEHARQYALEREYSIDEMGVLALYARIDEMQTSDHFVTTAEVEQIMDEAIERVDKKDLAHFKDILFGQRYDENDCIIIREKDFVAKR